MTAVKAPDGVNANDLRKILLQEHETALAGGQQKLDGKIFRIGHLGLVSDGDIEAVMAALKASLPKVGVGGTG